MKLETVVIGVDFSPASLEAVRWVASHLAPDARLVLVHCVEAPQAPSYFPDVLPSYEEIVRGAEERARDRLEEIDGSLPDDRVTIEVRTGAPWEKIAEIAAETAADLIVVGPHGRRRGIWGGPGSTAERLLHVSPAPVLLARGCEERSPKRILVPVDDSNLTPIVLGWAAYLQSSFQSQIIALHVVGPMLHGHLRLVSSATKAQEVEERARLAARTWLEQQVEASGFGMDDTRLEVLVGHPGYEILAATERFQSDLIVMGTRGAGAVGRALVGSVARTVLRGASCPVLGVRGS